VSAELLLLALAFPCGLALQRHRRGPQLNRLVWESFFWTIAPAAIVFTYTTVVVDRALVAALVVVAVSSWLTLGVAAVVARIAGRDRRERGALVLGAGWGNTVALGYPLAAFAYGTEGLALQVLYAQFYFGVPGIAVSTTVAREAGAEDGRARPGRRATVRAALNPPLVAALAAGGLRFAGVDLTALAEPLGAAARAASGPVGLLQLGLALPLKRVSHDARDLSLAAVALCLRHGLAPLMIVGVAAAAGVDIPAVFILAAAAPAAFHVVTLASVFDVRPELIRLIVVVSTVAGGAAILSGVLLTR
jgi:predicted permease